MLVVSRMLMSRQRDVVVNGPYSCGNPFAMLKFSFTAPP
jgi:hypothetical protein